MEFRRVLFRSRQIVGRAELIDVVIPPAESCLLAEGLDAAPIGPDEVEPDGQSRVRLDRDSRAKLFGCIYASARPGQKILVIAFEARHPYFGHVSVANGHRGRRFPQDTEPPAHPDSLDPSVIWQWGETRKRKRE